MNKIQIRLFKNHFSERWALLRHNQKHTKKVLLISDLFVLKNLLPGDTLCYRCLGELYYGIIPNLSVTPTGKYDNLVLINNIEFKYKTLDQLTKCLEDFSEEFLVSNGRLIISFEQRFLIYDRVSISIDTLLNNWAANLKKFKLIKNVSVLNTAPVGYGNHFFCFEYNA